MTESSADRPNLPDHIEETVSALAELHANYLRTVPTTQRVVDRSVRLIGQPRFVAVLTVFVIGWITLNLVLGRFGDALDLPPFAILQGVAQFAALYITVLILITQRHETEQSDHRQQLTLQLVMLSEQRNAKIVELIEEMRRDNPLMKDRIDRRADALSVPADPRQVLDAIKERHGELQASVDAEVQARGTGAYPPDTAGP